MTLGVNFNNLKKIEVERFLDKFSNRGRTVQVKPFGTNLSVVNRCFCIGYPSKMILPIDDNVADFLIKESFAYEHEDNNIFYNLACGLEQEIVEIDEAVSLCPLWSGNFWHWMTEMLPAVLIMEQYGYKGPYIITKGIKHIDETLRLFGIGRERILHSDKTYLAHNMFIPHIERGHIFLQNKALFHTYRSRLLDITGKLGGAKHCYVKRIGSRKIINEDELMHVLKLFDFEIFIPDGHTVKKQLLTMTNATVSFMPHGANSTLVITQPRYSAFLEAFNWTYIGYYSLHCVKNLNLIYIPFINDFELKTSELDNINLDLSGDENVYKKDRPVGCDIIVNCELLKITLDNILLAQKKCRQKPLNSDIN